MRPYEPTVRTDRVWQRSVWHTVSMLGMAMRARSAEAEAEEEEEPQPGSS